jgi:hypothetical protein
MGQSIRGGWKAAVMLGVAAAVSAAAEDAAPFLTAHRRAEQLAQTKNWPEAAKVYEAFAAEHASDAYAPVASVLQGIILRRELKQPAQAKLAFERAARAPDTPLGNELKQVAMAWIARMQMEQVDAALRKYYVKKVEYPEKLDELVAVKLVAPEELIDPWGKPIGYRAGTLGFAPKVPRQKYWLTCSSIEGDSGRFKQILKDSVTFGRQYQVKAITTGDQLKAVLAPADDPKKALSVSEGTKVGSAKVIKITTDVVILSDSDLVAVLTR